MERKKLHVPIEGSKIVCSKDCLRKKNNEEDMLKKMEEAIDNYKKDLAERDSKLEILESEAEQKVNYLLEELENRRKEDEAKANYIKRLKRASIDFQDEVMTTEENLLEKIRDLESHIARLHTEKTQLDQRILELQEELHEAMTQLTKLQGNLNENDLLKNNMLTSIETLSIENELYRGELKKLHNANFELEQEFKGIQQEKGLEKKPCANKNLPSDQILRNPPRSPPRIPTQGIYKKPSNKKKCF
ncbi:unnamed protein product [Phaedon cochleariae]|uniref:Uncharacterized protein n=1 Tax=Phaedon cochleariae TaxID=80249 RepID=A0A9N9S7E2_PHACE|nr:unnamed protein product [Phaedon cochleariae]